MQNDIGDSDELSQEPYLLRRLASSYQILADLLSYQGQMTEAATIAELGYKALSRAIEQDPENADWQKRKYYYYYQRFKFSEGLAYDDIKRNLDFLEEAITADQFTASSAIYREILARHRLTAAEHLQTIGEFEQSSKYAELSGSAYESLLKEFSQNPGYLASLMASKLLQARSNSESGNSELAEAICGQVKLALQPVTLNNKDPRYSMVYAKALDCLGELDSHVELNTSLKAQNITGFRF